MVEVAAKKRKIFSLAAAVLAAAATLLAPAPADASRYLPQLSQRAAPPPASLEDLAPGADACHIPQLPLLTPADRRDLVDLAAGARLEAQRLALRLASAELEWGLKTASGGQTSGTEPNVRPSSDLGQKSHRPTFQGLWTDPVSGLSYARNRWYDPRNASWLSEDPLGAVDSPNLYAFVGWGPQSAVDPLGLCTVWEIATNANHCREHVWEGWLAEWEQDKDTVSTVVSFAPVVGDVKDFQEAITGKDLITGDDLTTGQQVLTLVAAVIPVVGGKALREAAETGIEGVARAGRRELDEVANLDELIPRPPPRSGANLVNTKVAMNSSVEELAERGAENAAARAERRGLADAPGSASRLAGLRAKYGDRFRGNLPSGISDRDVVLATVKSTRRQVQKLMQRDPVAKAMLEAGEFDLYGTYFHNRVFKRLRAANIPGLEVNRAYVRPGGRFGVRGDYRIPDFTYKRGTPGMEFWDVKPSNFNWNQQFQDLYCRRRRESA